MSIGKIRTKAHIIGDLGYNLVERQILLAGYTMTQVAKDYGHDGIITTFNQRGVLEYQYIFVQVKSTEQIRFSEKQQGFELSLSKKDLNNWTKYHAVSIVVLCDVEKEVSYYLHIQDYFSKKGIRLEDIRKYHKVFIPSKNILNPDTVMQLRKIKNSIL